MPQPLHLIGDTHVALEQIILVSPIRTDAASGDVFIMLRLQGAGDPVRIMYRAHETDRARADHEALIATIGEARLLGRPAQSPKPAQRT